VGIIDYFFFSKHSMQMATSFTFWRGCGNDVRPLASTVT